MNRFLQEAKLIETKWIESGILKDEFARADLAKLMECQRLHAETGAWDCCDECRERENNELLAKQKSNPEVEVQG